MIDMRLIARLGAAVCLGAVLTACGDSQSQGQGGSRPAPQVTALTIQPQAVTVYEEYAGRAQGAREVEVRARVEAPIIERRYTEGAFVKAGEALFRLDPKPFEVAVERAEAQVESAEASLRQARRQWDRVERLYESKAVSTRERDEAQSQLELARADVALAEAGLADAKIDLGYTEITSPVSGVTDLEALPEGGLVQPGDLLTTVTQLDPIHVRFALPEDDAYARERAEEALSGGGSSSSHTARLIMPDGSLYARKGNVDFTDSSVDPQTGTVRARAVFSNPNQKIRPGQFVRVRLETATLSDALVVPERAIATDQRGEAVYVINDEEVAQRRAIELGPTVAAGRVIADGLESGDRIIVDGLVSVRDGAPVQAKPLQAADRGEAGEE